jgi:hypothetical protein
MTDQEPKTPEPKPKLKFPPGAKVVRHPPGTTIAFIGGVRPPKPAEPPDQPAKPAAKP